MSTAVENMMRQAVDSNDTDTYCNAISQMKDAIISSADQGDHSKLGQ
jgi:hypothetical protein